MKYQPKKRVARSSKGKVNLSNYPNFNSYEEAHPIDESRKRKKSDRAI